MEYGPTGFVRVHTPEEILAFARNRNMIHDHSWLGGELISYTNMPGEPNYSEKEWYCQFCGVRCRGESIDYASKSPYVPEGL